MRHQEGVRVVILAALTILVSLPAGAGEKAKVDSGAVEKSLAALGTYDWGSDRSLLQPIDAAVVATHGDAAARKDLETRLVAVLKTGAPVAAKDYVCRKLAILGTAESVPALASLLADKDLSHMSRYALERIPAPEAAQAMREALPKLNGPLKVGVIGSLGARRDAGSTSALVALLGDANKSVRSAAAAALGNLGSPEAAKALGEFIKKASAEEKQAAADASLTCAERLLADGKKAEAIALYKSLSGDDQPKHVRLAAARGLLAAAGKKN